MTYVRGDGSSRRIAVTVVPTKKIDGNGGVVAAYLDVTVQRGEELRREDAAGGTPSLPPRLECPRRVRIDRERVRSVRGRVRGRDGSGVTFAGAEMPAEAGEALLRGTPATVCGGRATIVPLTFAVARSERSRYAVSTRASRSPNATART